MSLTTASADTHNARPSFSSLGMRANAPTIARLMGMALESPDLLSLAAGFTDTGSLPVDMVQAAAVTMRETSRDPEYLQYGANPGRPLLRKLLADRLLAAEPGLDARAIHAGTFVTNGSQQALYLAMQVLCEPGDIVLVDRPSYFVFLEMLTGLGVQACSIPTNADGSLDEDGLNGLLRALDISGRRRRVKAVYFVSYYSNPSGRSMETSEKAALGRIFAAGGWRIPVVEDAAYRDLYFDQAHAVPSVFSTSEWDGFPRLYLSTLTKPYATGLKVGYGICSDAEWRDRMLNVKGHHDFGTSNYNQALCEQAVMGEGFDRQLAKIRPLYRAKMETLNRVLVEGGLRELGWKWLKPEGGLYLWLEAPAGLTTGLDSEFCQACVSAGVLYVPGELCYGDNAPSNRVRFSYGVLNETQLADAGQRFVSVARRFAKS